jgi:hypothetical protein
LVFGFGEEKVDVLGHENVSVNIESMTFAEFFEGLFNGDSGVVVAQVGETTVTTEGDEV